MKSYNDKSLDPDVSLLEQPNLSPGFLFEFNSTSQIQ